MKKWITLLLCLLMLAGCAADETVEVEVLTEIATEAEQESAPPPQPQEEKTEEIPEEDHLPRNEELVWTERGDFTIFEERFYGSWELMSADRAPLIVSTTYQGADRVFGESIMNFSETESDWYMLLFNGGTGSLARIPKSDPSMLYYYLDWAFFDSLGPVSKTKFDLLEVYKYVGERSDYSTELGVGEISVYGIQKLASDYGVYLWDHINVSSSDGRQWSDSGSIEMPQARYYLLEAPTEERIVFACSLYPAELDAYEEWEAGNPIRRTNIVITLEKQDGQWTVTSADLPTLEQELNGIGYLEETLNDAWYYLSICAPDGDHSTAIEYQGEKFTYEVYEISSQRDHDLYWNYQTEAKLRSYLASAFTEECIEYILENSQGKIYLIDGLVYTSEGARGCPADYGYEEYEIVEMDDDHATLQYTVYSSAAYDEGEGKVLETYEIPVVRTENGWRLNGFYRPY